MKNVWLTKERSPWRLKSKLSIIVLKCCQLGGASSLLQCNVFKITVLNVESTFELFYDLSMTEWSCPPPLNMDILHMIVMMLKTVMMFKLSNNQFFFIFIFNFLQLSNDIIFMSVCYWLLVTGEISIWYSTTLLHISYAKCLVSAFNVSWISLLWNL